MQIPQMFPPQSDTAENVNAWHITSSAPDDIFQETPTQVIEDSRGKLFMDWINYSLGVYVEQLKAKRALLQCCDAFSGCTNEFGYLLLLEKKSLNELCVSCLCLLLVCFLSESLY